MLKDEIRVAVAKLDGIDFREFVDVLGEITYDGPYILRNSSNKDIITWGIPNYTDSYDAIIPILQKLLINKKLEDSFIYELDIILNNELGLEEHQSLNWVDVLSASPLQLCEALLWTFKILEEYCMNNEKIRKIAIDLVEIENGKFDMSESDPKYREAFALWDENVKRYERVLLQHMKIENPFVECSFCGAPEGTHQSDCGNWDRNTLPSVQELQFALKCIS
jgi:hypothetical protein